LGGESLDTLLCAVYRKGGQEQAEESRLKGRGTHATGGKGKGKVKGGASKEEAQKKAMQQAGMDSA
jgi:hypothetical protein